MGIASFPQTTTRPWGYVELLVTFGEQETAREVKIQFLVVDCPSLYNCIFGRPTLAELTAVPSTVHLKMKYYTKLGRVVTIHGDIEAARRCYDAAVKGQAVASTRKKGGNKSVIQEILPRPSIDKLPPPLEVNAIGDAHCWMTPIYNYLTRDELPADPKEATTVKRRACSYVLLEGKLYRRGFSIPLLKCVEEEKVPDILGEIHRGINAQHLGGRSLARKALRAGYYWPTMQNDSKEHVKRYDMDVDEALEDAVISYVNMDARENGALSRRPQESGHAFRAKHNIARNFKNNMMMAKSRLPHPFTCRHCNARLFHHESRDTCCNGGKVSFSRVDAPIELQQLFLDGSAEGKHFRQHIRSYNHVLSFTSIGVHVDENILTSGRGIYTFRAQGAFYHNIGGFYPNEGVRPRFLQLYIYDTDNELHNRMQENPQLHQNVVHKLQKMLHQFNPFVIRFKQLSILPNISECSLILKEHPSNHHQYNLPTAEQVAAIIVGCDADSMDYGRDINVIRCDGNLKKVQETKGY
ncbi:hypothetical protein KIW84_011814 [Lathyrus oleraceus]|uniref:Uncharacterized protein n=1 Tax=Pisum sativum TaxID=3888 RepID=A0A9D5GVN6_PEA|nr:hypothetical protein KIW84_011814 [Pisum sativum]